MQHLDEGTVHAWLDGALPPAESADVERHVAQCGECAAMVAEARGLIAGATRIVSSLDVVRGGVIPKAPRTATSSTSVWRSLRLTPTRAALAATVLIAVSTMLTVRHDTPDKIVPSAARESAAVAAAMSRPEPAPSILRREVADARSVGVDSIRTAPTAKAAPSAKAPASTVVAGNLPVAQNIVASAPAAPAPVPSAPPVAATSSVADAAVLEARRTVSKTTRDSTARDAAAQRVSAASAAGAAGFAPTAERARRRVDAFDAIGGASAMLAGCYQFVVDSAFKSSSLPERFALDPLQADTTLNVIRAVNADGRLDGPIPGSRWTPLTGSRINLRFASVGPTQPLSIFFPAGGSTGVATLSTDGRVKTLAVTRVNCRP